MLIDGGRITSESFSSAVQRIDLRPYIDELEVEMSRLARGEKPKTASEWELELGRIQGLVRDQSRRLARDLGMAGDPTMLFMLLSGVISVAWAAFAIKISSVDETRPFDQRIDMLDLLAALPGGISTLIDKSSSYADIYKK